MTFWPLIRIAVVPAIGLLCTQARSQPAVKTDGQWRATLGAAVSYASGNTESSSFSLKLDAVRATVRDKVTVHMRSLYGKTDGKTTAEQIGLGGRYELNLSTRIYAFGQADFLRDEPANLRTRISAAGGLGYKLINTEDNQFNVFGGLGYTHDRFFSPRIVADSLRSTYGHAEVTIGEESNHHLSGSTNFKQRLAVYPNLAASSQYRAEFDASVAVAINRTMNLTAGLNYRYNSDPGIGLKTSDTLFLTGISVKFE